MMNALASHEMDGSRTERLGPAIFGAQFHHVLPEDDFDRQPYQTAGGRFLVAADARADNRDELRSALGLSTHELRGLSDTELLAGGWERWNLGLIDRLLGDVALAVWDNVTGELTLVRSPLSSRPIFFSRSADSIAFASLPTALCVLPAIGRVPDLDELARFLGGGLFQASMSSLFNGIHAVPQGKAVILKASGIRLQTLWSPGERQLEIRVDDAGELIRQELDRATQAQSRRRSGTVALMLSSGRDSSAVAAAAANGCKLKLLALTAAPRSAIDGLQKPWIADESGIAARTAEQLGLDQRTCRSEATHLAELLDRVAAALFQPFNNPVNLPWIGQLARVARQAGASVMMTGSAGNFTVSLGGPSFLSDYLRDRGLRRWFELARVIRRKSELSWPRMTAHSFGSLIPAAHYSWLRKAAGAEPVPFDLPLLREPIRNHAEAVRRSRLADPRPKPRRREQISALVQRIVPGDKYSLSCWGVDVRDPTADRRLAEICMALPVEALVGPDAARPAYSRAFHGRLPVDVIESQHAGAQAADWFETIRPQDVMDGYRGYAQNPVVERLFDLRAVESMIGRWPRSGAAADAVYDEYCDQLLGGLAVASFIYAHFPS